MPTPQPTEPDAAPNGVEVWPELRVRVPPAWKRWLEEIARTRALSVADVVRQCIRDLMIRRHDAEPPA